MKGGTHGTIVVNRIITEDITRRHWDEIAVLLQNTSKYLLSKFLTLL